jgi:hypothetical protein
MSAQAGHTPGPCGCYVMDDDEPEFFYCHLHASAPALLEVLEVVPDYLADSAAWAEWNAVRRAAIRAAKGESA